MPNDSKQMPPSNFERCVVTVIPSPYGWSCSEISAARFERQSCVHRLRSPPRADNDNVKAVEYVNRTARLHPCKRVRSRQSRGDSAQQARFKGPQSEIE